MAEEKKKLEGGNSHKEYAAVVAPRRIPERKEDDGFAKKAENFFEPIVNDVIIPSAQDTILDIVQSILGGIMNGIASAITGEPVSNRSVPVRRNSHNGHTDYNSISHSSESSRRRKNRDDARVTETTRLRDLRVGSRADAVAVIEQLYDILEKYNQVTCNDLYGLEEIDKTCPYTYTNFGWTDLGNAGIISNSDGTWSFDLPRPVQLNR